MKFKNVTKKTIGDILTTDNKLAIAKGKKI